MRSNQFRVAVLALPATLFLVACGGSGGEPSPEAQPVVSAAPSAEPSDGEAVQALEAIAASVTEPPAGSQAPVVVDRARVSRATEAATAWVSPLGSGTVVATSGRDLLTDVQATTGCREGYVPPAALNATRPVDAVLSYAPAELDVWRYRVQYDSFARANGYTNGSPDETPRLIRNSVSFLLQGEAGIEAGAGESKRATHGTWARDMAFIGLMYPHPAISARLRSYLLAQAANPGNDFTRLCLRQLDGSVRDAWFAEADWLLRYIMTYDYARGALSAADKLVVENFIRRNAYFFATQLDWSLSKIFPRRLEGNYDVRLASAAPTNDATRWLSKRYDTNGDCVLDGADNAASFPAYTYVRADGSTGPRISVLSQWYNNRKSVLALSIGAAGLLLDDRELSSRGKRYFTEWLAYSVWGDGSEGEYARNGDYCVPRQGVIYASSNLQGALLLGDLMARRGDNSLMNFETRDGLIGTEVAANAPAKSLAAMVSTQIRLGNRELGWYEHKPHLTTQVISEATHLGRMENPSNGATRGTDNYHELGWLLAADRLPSVPIAGYVLRDPAVTSRRFPGNTGSIVATGYGSWLGSWNDAFNMYPSALLQRVP